MLFDRKTHIRNNFCDFCFDFVIDFLDLNTEKHGRIKTHIGHFRNTLFNKSEFWISCGAYIWHPLLFSPRLKNPLHVTPFSLRPQTPGFRIAWFDDGFWLESGLHRITLIYLWILGTNLDQQRSSQDGCLSSYSSFWVLKSKIDYEAKTQIQHLCKFRFFDHNKTITMPNKSPNDPQIKK